MKKTLKTINLTNGEFGTVAELVAFLQWMKQESAPVPDSFSGEECDALMVRYVLHLRKAVTR